MFLLFISQHLYNGLTLDEESKPFLQASHAVASVVSSLCTHLNELPVLRPDEEQHPGLLPDRQHCRHVVVPEEDRLRPQSLLQLNTDMSTIRLHSSSTFLFFLIPPYDLSDITDCSG